MISKYILRMVSFCYMYFCHILKEKFRGWESVLVSKALVQMWRPEFLTPTSKWMWGRLPPFDLSIQEAATGFPEQAGDYTSCISKLWIQMREPASINKVESNWKRHPKSTLASTYNMYTGTRHKPTSKHTTQMGICIHTCKELHTQIMHIKKRGVGDYKAVIIYCSSQYCMSAIWSMFTFFQVVRQVLEAS